MSLSILVENILPKKNTSVKFSFLSVLSRIIPCFVICSVMFQQTSQAAIKVDATTLIEDYRNNEVAADAKYKGKEVEVIGEVERVSSNFGKVSVTLGGMVGVACYFSKANEAEAGSLSKGQTVSILGMVDGKMMGVNLKECKLAGNNSSSNPAGAVDGTPQSGSKTVECTAEEIDNAYEANEVKADSTYKGKTVVIRGRVAGISKDLFEKIYIELKGHSEFLGVQCYISPNAQAKTADLSSGSEVKLRGKVKGKMMVVTLESCEFVD